jgi:hypothetical protein
MSGQDKSAPAQSPTTGQVGKTATEKASPETPMQTPATKRPTQTPGRAQQTVPRRPPPWER